MVLEADAFGLDFDAPGIILFPELVPSAGLRPGRIRSLTVTRRVDGYLTQIQGTMKRSYGS